MKCLGFFEDDQSCASAVSSNRIAPVSASTFVPGIRVHQPVDDDAVRRCQPRADDTQASAQIAGLDDFRNHGAVRRHRHDEALATGPG